MDSASYLFLLAVILSIIGVALYALSKGYSIRGGGKWAFGAFFFEAKKTTRPRNVKTP